MKRTFEGKFWDYPCFLTFSAIWTAVVNFICRFLSLLLSIDFSVFLYRSISQSSCIDRFLSLLVSVDFWVFLYRSISESSCIDRFLTLLWLIDFSVFLYRSISHSPFIVQFLGLLVSLSELAGQTGHNENEMFIKNPSLPRIHFTDKQICPDSPD